MSRGTIRVELYDYDPPLLVVTAVKGHFSGQGKSWVSDAALQSFADDLNAYPIEKATLELNEFGHIGSIEISVEPSDLVGHLVVRIGLMDGEAKFPMSSTIYLAAEYSQIARFADQMKLMASGEATVIELTELP